ncbi:MAG: L-serine dehydratase, iron-sulfur-dependent subunit alpha, L-serine dehydratase [Candidatus Peregrinibacteria bacterium GW2011_GWC2_39_14]|nr:MAG: L-serine dehydratase, iron-sulfur-dependent, alpha subunit [Candidatus Peregrinibacteria bacterium GW2011_GWA2_38_36]KKR05200.1 MAG: L-serine dehydratase, iron-sulfur-dependent subunit alpha, L-serine dehydratase [Candidatus Peregrinibacteria bacterium GW2011_GWC2_39_14]
MKRFVFHTGAELLRLAEKYKMPISEIALNYEQGVSEKTEKEVIAKMKRNLDVMREAVKSGLRLNKKSFSGMSGGNAGKMLKYAGSKSKKITSKALLKAMAYAIACGETNAQMGRIVAFPTAGASGVIPAAVLSVSEELKLSDEKIMKGLFTASAIGLIIAENATLAGAYGGCQAEIGSASAMAAAAITEMRGGTPKQCLDAASLSLKNMLGLTCDPIAGLVEVPCVKRNAMGVTNAFSGSEIALAGIESFVTFDDVVEAMKTTGEMMPSALRETALGGLALTPTGCRIRAKIGLPPIKSAH